MKDRIGRNINYLRVSITDLCNLRCKYCMPEEGIKKKKHEQILSLEEMYEIIRASVSLGVNKVRITGGEPLVRKGVVQFVEKIGQLQGIEDLAMTTNGILLKEYAEPLKSAGLKRVNISLDTLKEDRYREITRGGELRDVLDGMEEAKRVGLLPIKINVVLIGGFNDDEIEDFIQLTVEENVDVRFIELMPIGQASTWSKRRFIPNTLIRERVKDLMPIYDGDKSSPAKYYRLPNGKGKIGLINPISSHFCKHCNRMRLTADGKLKPCLHSNQELDVRAVLKLGEQSIEKLLKDAITAKPIQHELNEQNSQPIERDMVRIGG